jgi:N-acyl-D-amino-acid deacylase
MTSRRDFVRAGTGTLVGLAGAPQLLLASRATADIVIRGGTVFDGLGGPGVERDVVIAGGRISSIARNAAEKGATEIDAKGPSPRGSSTSIPTAMDPYGTTRAPSR